MSDIVLDLQQVTRSFVQGERALQVLRGVDLTLMAGSRSALIGPSGSGKSTLLQIAGLLERPDAGQVLVAGTDASRADDSVRTALRRQSIGFVYQFHHLLPEFSARENIILPQMIAGVDKAAAGRRADELLALVGLAERAQHRPGQLSGGEQQRIAIARALANNPRVLIADEPTGNLDPRTADHVFAVLRELAASQNFALLMATHNHELAQRMDRVVELVEGAVVDRA
jgi:lipoprotein-releasing system ATP-binding protein